MLNKRTGRTLATWLERAWYQGSAWLAVLYPLSWLVAGVARVRLAWRRFRRVAPPVPVLVVGNITLGGTGKTPLVIALCKALKQRGLKVAVISRGYGARPPREPWQVTGDQSSATCGDEPLLIARHAGVPVVIDRHRARALAAVVDAHEVDVVISDDGLQHLRLPRTAEIIVLDGQRMLGNRRCLPAGPLREPATRLQQVDWVVVNGRPEDDLSDAVVMNLELADPVNLYSGQTLPMEEFVARFPLVHGIAGIGNPQRFFDALRAQGLHVVAHPYADHHAFEADDFAALQEATVLMTEKDAVKCQAFAGQNFWYVPVTARLPSVFFDAVHEKLTRSRP